MSGRFRPLLENHARLGQCGRHWENTADRLTTLIPLLRRICSVGVRESSQWTKKMNTCGISVYHFQFIQTLNTEILKMTPPNPKISATIAYQGREASSELLRYHVGQAWWEWWTQRSKHATQGGTSSRVLDVHSRCSFGFNPPDSRPHNLRVILERLSDLHKEHTSKNAVFKTLNV